MKDAHLDRLMTFYPWRNGSFASSASASLPKLLPSLALGEPYQAYGFDGQTTDAASPNIRCFLLSCATADECCAQLTNHLYEQIDVAW